ncbi:MATE family efflux transporter [Haloimpatiens lingqiaonensis]|uniref:MATE family efflux transporter n=1 Tax=Haloimpatiens lingqiaonensis TaxID=1380675 RepID=UPI0010FE3A4C|nr:MATE family efflux transporter [Haloimpatiens lingqiaonensis]
MNKGNNIIEGNILRSLLKLALPIMGTSCIQMAYSMTDMIWIGRVGSKASAAVGIAGYFTWFAVAFIVLSKVAAEIGISQAVGRGDMKEARKYVKHSIQINIFLGLIYGAVLIIFRETFINFFNSGNKDVFYMSMSYLVIISLGMNFYFINPVLTGIYNGYGNSSTPFIINTIGLIVNMILDPILIYGIGPFPKLGVKGAAMATIIAQAIVTCVFVCNIYKTKFMLFHNISLFTKPEFNYIKRVFKLSTPVAIQEGMFCVFSMVIVRIVSKWGYIPIAVQNVGSQIESLSWLTAGGFSTALRTFVGQNYGAEKWDRIKKGYITSIKIVGTIGILVSFLLFFGAKPIFSLFIPGEPETIKQGIVYLKILSLSQFFMCIEITTAGAFNGLGKTMPPSFISTLFTGLRIPFALILSSEKILGLNGVWWTVSMSSVIKGVVLITWFSLYLKNRPEFSNKNKIIYKN